MPDQNNNNSDTMTLGDFMAEKPSGPSDVVSLDQFNAPENNLPPIPETHIKGFFQNVSDQFALGVTGGAEGLEKIAGAGDLTKSISLTDAEKQYLNQGSETGNLAARYSYHLSNMAGQLISTLPVFIGVGGLAAESAIAAVPATIGRVISLFPQFAIGAGIFGAAKGAEETSKKASAAGMSPLENIGLSTIGLFGGGAHDLFWNTAMGKVMEGGSAVKIIPGLAAVNVAQTTTDSLAQNGRMPTKQELGMAIADSVALGAVASIIPHIFDKVGEDQKAILSGYAEKMITGIKDGNQKVIEGAVDGLKTDAGLSQDTKTAISEVQNAVRSDMTNHAAENNANVPIEPSAEVLDAAKEIKSTPPQEEKLPQESQELKLPSDSEAKATPEEPVVPKSESELKGAEDVSSEKSIASQNRYVNDEPLNLFAKENKKGKVDLKSTGDEIRQRFVSYMDKQIVRMNQQRGTWKKLVSDPVERQASFYMAAGAEGDPVKLQGFIDKMKEYAGREPLSAEAIKKMRDNGEEYVRPEYAKELLPKLEKGLNLSDSANQMLKEGNDYYNEAGTVAKERGTIRSLRDNYQSLRLYKPEPPEEFTKTELGKGIKRSTSHSKQRVYDNIFDAILNGKELAHDDYANLAAIHNEELTYVNAGRRLTDELSDQNTGLGKWVRRENIPEGWEQVGRLDRDVPLKDHKTGEALIGEDGNQLHSYSVFAAPKEIVKALEAVSDPNYLRKVNEFNALGKVNGFVKSFNVALSFFHHFQFVKQTLSSYHGEKILSELPQMISKMETPEFKGNELYFHEVGGKTTMRDANMDILSDLKEQKGFLLDKISGLPVAKQALQLTDASNRLLFDYMQRFMKVSTFAERVGAWIKDNPEATDQQILEAHRGFAKAINSTFGTLNWDALGISKTQRAFLRLGLFAPDWLLSSILHTKYAFSDGGTAGHVARANLVKGGLVGLAFTEALNMLTTGKTSDKNKKGHFFEWEVAPNVYVNFFGGATGELLKFASNVMETGGLQGAIRYLSNKGSPAVRLLGEAITGVNYSGRSIWEGKTVLEKNINGLLNLAATVTPLPFALQPSTLDYAIKEKRQSILGAIALALGLGRYSKNKK